MKSDEETAIAFAQMWKECKRKMGGKGSSAWTSEGLKGRQQGIEDCAHAAGIWTKFLNARDGRPVKDLPGQMMLGQVAGFLPTGSDPKAAD